MKKIVRTCVCDTLYSLFQYMLISTEEEIRKTQFYVGTTILDSVCCHLPHVVKLENKCYERSNILNILQRMLHIKRWIHASRTEIFAQDHIAIAPHIIGNSRYILLEDAPGCYGRCDKIQFLKPKIYRQWWKRLFYSVAISPMYKQHFGVNRLCKSRIYTDRKDEDTEFLRGKKREYCDMTQLWNSSTESKKNYIRELFGIDESLLEKLRLSSVVVFTQPLREDFGLTDEEYVSVYAPYIAGYKKEGVIVKQHPRDKFDIGKFFSEVDILDTKAPMQVLSVICGGDTLKTAVTVCSTAVSNLGSNVEIVWIGTRVNEKIFRECGELPPPKRKVLEYDD